MDQLYYTQCPVGYGLGASNGFQVKRLSPGFPLSGDLRHLALRAFLPGGRVLAPRVVRYRKGDDGQSEVLCLTPRSHEFETERGLWGRPGGQFAHALRLDRVALRSIKQWPAGLLGAEFWRKTDPEPSLGRVPEPVELSLRVPATFSTLADLARGQNAGFLSKLFTAMAIVARDGRTLVLLDRPECLGERIALMTLAIPEALRPSITFSTYHDKPDELTGFRVQGTVADARLNRPLLVSLGILADVAAGTFEPEITPASWATTLTKWIFSNNQEAWERADRFATLARSEPGFWADNDLDRLYELAGLDQTRAGPDEGKKALALARWAGPKGLGGPTIDARGPNWWVLNRPIDQTSRAAFLAHLRLREAFDLPEAEKQWGKALAASFESVPADGRFEYLASAIASVPDLRRPGLVAIFVAKLPAALGNAVIGWLKAQPGVDARVLFPLELSRAVEKVASGGPPVALVELLGRVRESGFAGSPLFDRIAETTGVANPEARAALARTLGPLLARSDSKSGKTYVRWAVGRGNESADWLKPYLRNLNDLARFRVGESSGEPRARLAHQEVRPPGITQADLAASSDASERWKEVASWVDPRFASEFAQLALNLATEQGIADTLFCWSVESLLLPMEEARRPQSPDWAALYLDKMSSGLTLFLRLFSRDYRELGVRQWLDSARSRGELSTTQAERIDASVRFARALKSGDSSQLRLEDLPTIPDNHRGELFELIVGRFPKSDHDLHVVVKTCAEAWPGGFLPRQPGLAQIARVLASRLIMDRGYPELWIFRFNSVLQILSDQNRHGPGSLAAEVVAASTRHFGENDPNTWQFRAALLANAELWKGLCDDISQSIKDRSTDEALHTFDEWDRYVSKGIHTARFYELWLNSCDEEILAALVANRAEDLRTLPVLSWWAHGDFPDDLREAYARLSPMDPLSESSLNAVQRWMRQSVPGRGQVVSRLQVDPDAELIPLDDVPGVESQVPYARPAAPEPPISEPARARWRCLEALSTFYRPGLDSVARWQTIQGWTRDLPLAAIPEDDRYAFLSILTPKLEAAEGSNVARLANWLVRCGMNDPERLTDRVGAKIVGDLQKEWRTVLREARERPLR